MAEAPIPFKSLARRIKARDALKRPPSVALRKTMFLPGDDPKVEVSAIKAVRPLFQENGGRMFKVDVDVGRFAVGRHSFPPGLEGIELKRRRDLLVEEDHPDALVGLPPGPPRAEGAPREARQAPRRADQDRRDHEARSRDALGHDSVRARGPLPVQ